MSANHNEDPLGPLVRKSWTVPIKSNPNFRSAVWTRIEASRHLPATWSGWLKLNSTSVAMYAAASIILAGAGGGYLAANQTSRDRDQLIQRYVTRIDPHQRVNLPTSP